MNEYPRIGSTVQLWDGNTGVLRDYMDKEGLPHVAVIEMHDPISEDQKWQCVDMTKIKVTEFQSC
ncbi:hypothetical protein LCGC14_2048920 [marine sediment metagenome]|uniref:Uncharacterized protein n=1 Tax=marine sediment metagenome TaxID=412755 RepID=A0A0F9FC47_9ZZZZ